MKFIISVLLIGVLPAIILALATPNHVSRKRNLYYVTKSDNIYLKSQHHRRLKDVLRQHSKATVHESSDLVSIGGEYYFSGTKDLDFDGATNYCIENKLRLVSIPTEKDNEQLSSSLAKAGINTNKKRIWSSGHRRTDDHENWIWQGIDKPVAYMNWEGGQPNNAAGDEDCIEIYQGHDNELIWNDVGCDKVMSFVCQDISA